MAKATPPSNPPAEHRAEDLAHQAGITVQLLRSYQSKGLLPPPRHEGRIAWYGPRHAERLRLIRDLKDRGYTLKMIRAVVQHEPDLPLPGEPPRETLRIRDVADRTGLAAEMIRALEASHLLRPHRVGRSTRYTDEDVRAVRNVLLLLGADMSLDEFLRIARPQIESIEALARQAASVWLRTVGHHEGRAGSPRGAAGRAEEDWVLAALGTLVSAVSELVAYNAGRAVFNAAQTVVDRRGSETAKAALRRELERQHPDLTA